MNLLIKLFVKNHESSHNPAVRSAIGSLAGTVGIVCNVFLFLSKLAAGLLSGSLSIIADAVNNLTDASSSLVTVVGFRLARQPADRDHPYGHGRYEYLSGLAVAALILVLGAELVQSAFGRIFTPTPVEFTLLTAGILILSMAVKLWMSLSLNRVGQNIDSSALRAAAVDARNDVLASGAVLLGCLAERFLNWKIDGWVGLAVAVFILYSGWQVARETISPLLGRQADRELVESIRNLILSHEKVLGIHDLLIHDYGPGQCFASVHVEISAKEDALESHSIIDHIERDALSELNVNLVIHYDPVVLGDRKQDQLRVRAEEIVKLVNPQLAIHDFRLIRNSKYNSLAFDLEVPFDLGMSEEELSLQVKEALRRHGIHCYTVIRFDHT